MTIVFIFHFRLFRALVPMQVTPTQMSSMTLQERTLSKTLKRWKSSRTKAVMRLSEVMGRFITISTIRIR